MGEEKKEKNLGGQGSNQEHLTGVTYFMPRKTCLTAGLPLDWWKPFTNIIIVIGCHETRWHKARQTACYFYPPTYRRDCYMMMMIIITVLLVLIIMAAAEHGDDDSILLNSWSLAATPWQCDSCFESMLDRPAVF